MGLAATEDQEVSHNVGARDSTERLGGQPQAGDQVGGGCNILAGSRFHRIHRVPAGHDGDVTAGRDQGQRFDDEVVVNVVTARVVHRVGQCVAAKGNIADRGGERAIWDAGTFKAFVADVRGRIEQRGDRRGDVVGFDTDHGGAFGGVTDECAASTTRFEHTATGKTRRA